MRQKWSSHCKVLQIFNVLWILCRKFLRLLFSVFPRVTAVVLSPGTSSMAHPASGSPALRRWAWVLARLQKSTYVWRLTEPRHPGKNGVLATEIWLYASVSVADLL
jgi:hypothetical protein